MPILPSKRKAAAKRELDRRQRARQEQDLLSLPSFYTMRMRTRCGDDQRVIGFEPTHASDRERLRALRHSLALAIWHAGYVEARSAMLRLSGAATMDACACVVHVSSMHAT